MLHGSWQASNMYNDDADWYIENIDYFSFPRMENSNVDQSITIGTSIGNAFSFNTGDDIDLLNACFILATRFYNDDIYNSAQLAAGLIPSIENISDTITDHCMQLIWNEFKNAGNIQLWYDHYLPLEVGEAHKNACQDIFGLTKTPSQANEYLNSVMRNYINKERDA